MCPMEAKLLQYTKSTFYLIGPVWHKPWGVEFHHSEARWKKLLKNLVIKICSFFFRLLILPQYIPLTKLKDIRSIQ